MPEANRRRVLINLHGGGFNSDSGSLIEGIPIANLAKIKVVSVYYRLAPENPFPPRSMMSCCVQRASEKLQAAEHRDFRNLGRGHPDRRSCGPLEADGSAASRRSRHFFRHADFSQVATRGSSSRSMDFRANCSRLIRITSRRFLRVKTDRKDPVLSPIFADLRGMPPTLLVTAPRHLAEWYDDFPPRAAQRWR